MSVNDYPIRYSVNTETTLEEPIVGEWYCGFNIIGDENDEDADTYEKYQEGDICVYVGDGIFEDEESEEFLFTDYDFLIKQA